MSWNVFFSLFTKGVNIKNIKIIEKSVAEYLKIAYKTDTLDSVLLSTSFKS